MTNTEALRLALDALTAIRNRDDRNTCRHENTHRGGAIWTICDDCDAQWADDRGGMPEWEDPPEWGKSDAAIDACRAALAAPSVPSGEPVAWIYQNSNTEREYLVWQKGTGGRNWRPLYATPQPAPAGWRLVPAEPTEAMQAVIRNECDIYGSEWALYAAMLDAAPAAPGGA